MRAGHRGWSLLAILLQMTYFAVQAQIRDPCAGFECHNGGSCTAPADAPFCNCRPGFFGDRCQFNRDPCFNFRCENGGRCTAPADRPYCIGCNPGFTGVHCEVPLSQGGSCPVIEPGSVGICGAVAFCEDDRECGPGEKCCPMACGGKTCTSVGPPNPPPLTDVSNACATVDCIQGSECRIVHPCPTCEPTVTCVPTDQLGEGIDVECERQRYLQVLLVASSTTPTSYSQLKCRGPLATRDCPQGSVCVDDLRGGGTCCTGKPDPVDQCGGCPAGEVCVLRSPVCPPGRFCIQAFLPTCVPEECENCRADQDCIEAPNQPVCAVGQPCPIRHTCADKDRCGPTPCPPGQECIFVGTLCVDPAPGTPPDPTLFGCFDRYQCQATDQCGGCPDGQECVDTGIRCFTTPCDTYQCRDVDPCGNECREDQTCQALPPPCARPDCDALRLLNPNAPCPEPSCDPVYVCVDNPTPSEPVCGLRCPPTHRCTFVRPGCVPGRPCSITPSPTCVRVARQEPLPPPRKRNIRRCPRPSRRFNPNFGLCRLELSISTSCGRDSDCYGNKICCTSKCGNRVCMPSIPYY